MFAHRQGTFAYAMRALGRRELPEQIGVRGHRYVREAIVKHDFWAATGFYRRADDLTGDETPHRVVLKMGRTEPFLGLPLIGVGRWLCRREVRMYRALADVPNVPALLGTHGETGFVHAYVSGGPLERDRPVPDEFFGQLLSLMSELHRRGVAYVDANKPQNILLGDDGLPYLIDFQISYDLATFGGNNWLARRILARLQREDTYHVLKHKRKMRPDQLTPDESEESRRQSGFIRLHRTLTRPYFLIRRPLMRWLNRTGRVLPAGSD